MSHRASIIIPAYNESSSIRQVLESMDSRNYEIIVVDDGSKDNTHRIISDMGFRCIKLKKNRGKGHACRIGVEKATTNKIVIFDADNQFSTNDIPRMVGALETYDMVIGIRNMKKVPFRRVLSNRFAVRMINSITRREFLDVLCGFRAIRKDMFLGIGLEKDRYEFESEMTIKATKKGLKVSSIPVEVRYFKNGSGMSFNNSLRVTFYILKEFLKSRVGR